MRRMKRRRKRRLKEGGVEEEQQEEKVEEVDISSSVFHIILTLAHCLSLTFRFSSRKHSA